MKKKIVHFITSLRRGGAETLLVDLIPLLPEYDHCVLYIYDGINRVRLEELGIMTKQIKPRFFLYDPFFLIRTFKEIKKAAPDVLHTALWSANCIGRICAWFLGIPCVSVIHLGVDQDGTMRNLVDRLTFSLSQEVVAVSEGVYRSLVSARYLPAHRIKTILNGVNVSELKRQALISGVSRTSLGLDDRHFIIGSVGRFIARKNYAFLIDVFVDIVRDFPHACLLLVGFGQEEYALRLQAERKGVGEAVIFCVGNAACGYYPLFDCFILPSKQEGLSIALLEAMSFGLPCIVASSDTHEVIKHAENGLIIAHDDRPACLDALRLLLTNKSIGKTLGSRALNTVHDQFSIERFAAEYRMLFGKDQHNEKNVFNALK